MTTFIAWYLGVGLCFGTLAALANVCLSFFELAGYKITSPIKVFIYWTLFYPVLILIWIIVIILDKFNIKIVVYT